MKRRRPKGRLYGSRPRDNPAQSRKFIEAPKLGAHEGGKALDEAMRSIFRSKVKQDGNN
jgi:hypothetical protein